MNHFSKQIFVENPFMLGSNKKQKTIDNRFKNKKIIYDKSITDLKNKLSLQLEALSNCDNSMATFVSV